MNDLVQRLRAMATYESDPDGPCKQAADRIEELEAQVKALEKELEWDHDYQSVPRRALEGK